MNDCYSIIYNDEKLDSVQVKNKLASLQNYFLSLKEKGYKLFAIFMERSPELFITVHSSYLAGMAYIPLDPDYPSERINLILEEAQPDIVITEKHLVEKFFQNIETVFVEDLFVLNGEDHSKLKSPDLSPEDPAYIIYTSGSTGKPKGVVIPRRGLKNLMDSMIKRPGASSVDRILAETTISFDMSVPEIYLPLYTGAEVIILDKNSSRDPKAIINAIDKHDITLMQATPATWRMMIEEGWTGKKNLKALCGGETLPYDLAESLVDLCGELWNMYGPTETTVWSTCEKIEKGQIVSIGDPLDNTDIYILDDYLNPVLQGVEGHLYIGGMGLALGYHNRIDLTENSFISSPFEEGKKIYKTGDLVRFMSDGRLEYLGRSDFQVKIRGFRIELGDVESSLLKYHGVDNVVVHAQVLRNGMKELVAYIVSKHSIKSNELITFLSESLPDYMVPSYYMFLDSLPLSSNGKINRKALPIPQVKEIVDEDMIASSSLENKLIYIWKRVLFKEDIRPDQNFFELGGNSILAVQALREMNEICHNFLTLSTFFKYPVINQLIKEISKNEKKDHTVILLNGITEGVPLFCLGGIDLYQTLADCITERPVYGVYLPYEEQLIDHIQRDALNDWEYMTIEGMAKAYLREINKSHSDGSYHLLGISIAGMIAFEASKIIFNNEGHRGQLFLLDSHLSHAKHLSLSGKLSTLLRRLKSIKSKYRNKKSLSGLDLEYIVAMRDSISDRAEKIFDKEAGPLEGDIHLVKAMKNQYGRGETWDYDLGWSERVSGELLYCELPDDHLGILDEPSVKILAEYLKKKLK
jgi:amino acid adenylation domain-containing protein